MKQQGAIFTFIVILIKIFIIVDKRNQNKVIGFKNRTKEYTAIKLLLI